MKKIFLLAFSIIAFLSISTKTIAQFEKGQMMVGGSISFNSTKYATDATNMNKSSDFVLNPNFSTAISTNTFLGVGLSMETVTQTFISSNQTSKSTDQTTGISIFLKRYLPLSKNFYAFVGAALTPGRVSNTTDINDMVMGSTSSSRSGLSIDASFNTGIAYRISNKLLIDATFPSLVYLNYQHTASDDYGTVSTSSFSIGSGFSSVSLSNIRLGAFLLLHK